MSIRSRITASLTFVGLLLFGAYALVTYRTEEHDLRASAERELRILGRSLESAVANALRDKQRADVDAELASLEALAPAVDIHVHDAAGGTIALSPGASSDDAIESLIVRATLSGAEQVAFQPAEAPTRVVFATPLFAGGGTAALGALAVVRPLDDMNGDLSRTRRDLLIVVLAFMAVTTAVGMILGTTYVTRPLRAVLDGIRHVRDGDFRSQVPPARNDEMGALVDEFNAMVAALGQARRRLEDETDARLRMERGLQRVDKMATIGQLAAGLAHEIGSPLQVLSGRAASLAERSTEPDTRRQAHILSAQCARIAAIVERLLSYGRRRAASVAPCDLVAPVRAVLDLLEGEARRRQVKLQLEVDAGEHAIDGDADQLQQVVLNLVNNALAATPAGGAITVRVADEDDEVRLRVRDSGPGIPEEGRERLFEPFFTTRAADGGTGLGLAVVRAIALEHHGDVVLAPSSGPGAEFIVSFPHLRPAKGAALHG